MAAALIMVGPAPPSESSLLQSIEILAGHAGFADDATIEHSVIGGAARVYVTPRISLGPGDHLHEGTAIPTATGSSWGISPGTCVTRRPDVHRG